MRTADFDYYVPSELIAQTPATERDRSRLLVLQRPEGRFAHRCFRDLLEILRAGDVLVLNDSRVIPARLRAVKDRTGGQIEVLLIEENAVNDWWVMLRPGKRARTGTRILFLNRDGRAAAPEALVIEKNAEGHCRLRFSGTANISDAIGSLGEVPLPPYIARGTTPGPADDRERYQTVYARPAGSVAAPTAGLHFTKKMLDEIRSREVRLCFITLHVGTGTFAPVKAEALEKHILHEERFEIGPRAARTVNEAKKAGRRVIAVGTTTVRVLESVAAENQGRLVHGRGRTRIFIHPPFSFRITDALLTNFHLPRSTLLMLVSAFAAPGQTRGRDLVLAAYAEAIRERYRFYSYGDAMLIL